MKTIKLNPVPVPTRIETATVELTRTDVALLRALTGTTSGVTGSLHWPMSQLYKEMGLSPSDAQPKLMMHGFNGGKLSVNDYLYKYCG